ncbi:MAG: type II toxin-antitoxin system RatA family toxin [bacterium]
MVNVKTSRVIKAEPEIIWKLINEVERFPEWMPGVVEARVKCKPKKKNSGLGRQQILKTDMVLGKGESLQEVIAWEPPNKITWQHLRDVIDGNEFDYAKEIRTTLTITNVGGEVTFRMIGSWEPVGISGRLMNRTMKRMVTKNFEQALENLEKIIRQEGHKDS